MADKNMLPVEDYVMKRMLTKDDRTFTDVFASVKYKIEHNLPMATAKEELMEDFVKDWSEIFGYETVR